MLLGVLPHGHADVAYTPNSLLVSQLPDILFVMSASQQYYILLLHPSYRPRRFGPACRTTGKTAAR